MALAVMTVAVMAAVMAAAMAAVVMAAALVAAKVMVVATVAVMNVAAAVMTAAAALMTVRCDGGLEVGWRPPSGGRGASWGHGCDPSPAAQDHDCLYFDRCYSNHCCGPSRQNHTSLQQVAVSRTHTMLTARMHMYSRPVHR